MPTEQIDVVKTHFNPTFEGPKGDIAQLTGGVLDPGKNSAVIFRDNSQQNSSGFAVRYNTETTGVSSSDAKNKSTIGKFNVIRGG
ncbi:hypothetical protein PVK06_020379 [Gossypium arboreum]|uniref:Uncharacterized protein n=1 Tax=Gossypium arboreum TaxID=29729 RepID=A0ABR0PMN4_GOSAR|nr:hypothetical protein PVK06_020379 [Gossypium arboreum]